MLSPAGLLLQTQMRSHRGMYDCRKIPGQVESLAMFYASTGDGKEGVAAFLEKRAAEFTGRASEMPPFYPW